MLGIWTTDLKAQVGGVLLKAVVDAAKTEGGEAAFTQTVEGMGGKKRRNMILMEVGRQRQAGRCTHSPTRRPRRREEG